MVLIPHCIEGSFDLPIRHLSHMTTTGKRYIQRTRSKDPDRIIDARTRSLLNSVLQVERGRTLEAYLMAFQGKRPSK